MVIIFYLIGSIVTAYLVLNIYIWDIRRRVSHFPCLPVKYGLLWFQGSLVEIQRRRKLYAEAGKNALRLDVMIDISREKKWDVYVLTLFYINMIYVQDLGAIEKILPDRTNFQKSPIVNQQLAKIGNTRLFGRYGILSDPGTDIWAAKRRVVTHAFHRDSLRSMMVPINQITDKLMSKLKEKAGGTYFDIAKKFTSVAFEMVSVCGFDWDTDMVEEHCEAILDATDYVVEVLQMKHEEIWTFNLPWSRRAEKALLSHKMEPVRTIVRNHLKKRIEMINTGTGVDSTMVSHIIHSNQVTGMLTLEDLVDEYLTYLMAGMETTSSTLAFATFYLSVYPDVLARARDEVEEVLGERSTVTFGDLGQLKYLEMVIKETLRLNNPLRSTDRVVVSDKTYIQGQYVPKGTMLKIPTMEIHVDPRYWENPKTFNPDRFSRQFKRNSYSFMPFMKGPRNCIGKNFAMVVMKTVLARLLQTFELVNPQPEVKDVRVVFKATTRPENGVMMGLLLRKTEN